MNGTGFQVMYSLVLASDECLHGPGSVSGRPEGRQVNVDYKKWCRTYTLSTETYINNKSPADTDSGW